MRLFFYAVALDFELLHGPVFVYKGTFLLKQGTILFLSPTLLINLKKQTISREGHKL